MGNIVAQPRVRPAVQALFLLAIGGLTGCAHRDVVDTPVGWWHQLEGGAIAQQRPPPPGINDPYPAVGTTPAHPPLVASLALRQSVTASLLRQRNLTNRTDAITPLPPPPPPALAPARAQDASSATLDAAQSASPVPASRQASRPAADPAPELALPAVQVQPADVSAPVALPAIPGAPPLPPLLPGLRAVYAPTPEKLPDYEVAAASGTQIAFAPSSDSMLGQQAGALHALAARRGAGAILVDGYGDAAGFGADAQAQALTLASLRASRVAEALRGEGVPADAILLKAQAFGRGASASLVP